MSLDKFLLEAFGYLGTAFVLLSMLMTSVVKLRIFNLTGSVISVIYAFLSGTWPVVVLNFCLSIINVGQLVRLRKTKVEFTHVRADAQDRLLAHFLDANGADIQKYFPGFHYQPGEDTQAHMVFDGMEAVGVLIGQRQGNTFVSQLDYVTAKYRDCSIAKFLLNCLAQAGYDQICEPSGTRLHEQYLEKMGFTQENRVYNKTIE